MMAYRYMPLVDYTQIEASAPGRFILIGEFADLYEKNAIAMTIDRRIRIIIKPYKEGRLRLKLNNYKVTREWPTTSIGMNRLVSKFGDYLEYTDQIPAKLNHLLHKRYYQGPTPEDYPGPDQKAAPIGSMTRQADDGTMAFLILYAALGDSFGKSSRPYLDITIDSDIPIGMGLGSSSAYCVALTAALMKVFRVSAEPYVISNWALQLDKFFHKYSSGLSSSTIIHGGYCYYQHNKVKGYGVKHVNPVKVMVIDTGVGPARHPKAVYDMLTDLVQEDPTRVNNVFISIGDLAATTWRIMNQSKFHPRSIGDNLRNNQELLDSLGLGHEHLLDVCEKATQLRQNVKQTHCGRSAFLLFDETDVEMELNEYRMLLKDHGFAFEDYGITHVGLQVSKTKSDDIP